MIGVKRGLFGRKPMTGATMGGFGGGTFNMDGTPVDEPEMPHNYAQTEAPQGKGMFGGGTLRAIAGTIGDTLLQHNGMDPVYAPTMQAQRAAAAELAAEQRKRSMGLEDYEAKKLIDQRYQAPGDNIDLREDNAGNVWQFDKRTGQPISDKPVWVDKTPKEFVHEGMRFSIRNPYGTGDGGGVPTVSDEASYNALPPGTQYRDDAGNIRTKGGPTQQPASATFLEAFGNGL